MPSQLNLTIRPIQPQDDPFLEAIVTNVLGEHGCSGPGWASADVELKTMFHTYSQTGSQYYVIESTDTQKVCGGGGFSQLKGSNPEDKICELQKLYFTPECRGKGMGRKLLTLLIEKAAEAGYKTMYLESIPQLQAAVFLYQQMGFTPIPCNMGSTGHEKNCTVFMTRSLEQAKVPSLS